MQLRPLTAVLLFLFSSQALANFQANSRTLRVRLSSTPQTLDWNIATTGSENALIQNLMEGLFTQGLNGLPEKVLAQKVSWSLDRKKLTLEIKNHVHWSDGALLKSSQFIDSFARLLNPHLNSPNASLLFDVVGARDYFLGKSKGFSGVGLRAADDKHLVIELNEPRANFLSILTHPATFPIRLENPHLTLGPYRLQTYSPTSIQLQANNVKTPVQKAVFEVIPDGVAALEAYQAGKLDYLIQIEDSLFVRPEIKNLPPLKFVKLTPGVALLHFNPGHLMTSSPDKRRRIMSLIPLSALVEGYPGTREFAPSLIPAGMLGGPKVSDVSFFKPSGTQGEDPTAALTLAYPNDAFSKSIAETLQKKAAPLKLKVEALPSGALSAASQRYDLVLTLFSLDYGDPDQILASFLSQGTLDLFGTSTSQLLQILQNARATEDLTKRGQSYEEAANYLENEMAIVMPLFYRRRGYLLRPRFKFDDQRQGTVNLSQIRILK